MNFFFSASRSVKFETLNLKPKTLNLLLIIPRGGKESRGDGQHQPAPMQTALVGGVLEDFHRLGAAHVGVACRQFDKIRERVGHAEVNIMAQCFVQFFLSVLKVGGDGVEVVGGVDGQSRDGADVATDIEVLQTGGEVVRIVVKIEKFHGTVKIVVRTEQGGECPRLFMENKAQIAICRDGVIVTAQVIITSVKVVDVIGGDGGLSASHEGVQLDSVFLSAHLVVEGAFHIDNAGVQVQVCAENLLEDSFVRLIIFLALHSDIHAEQGDAEEVFRSVVVVPKGLHGLVGLYSIGIVGDTGGNVFCILVVGEDQVHFVTVTLET